MKESRKVKVSVSLPTDLVAAVDRQVRTRPKATRSGVMEKWLRRGATAQVESDLREEVISYYTSLDANERNEEDALGRALSRSARRLEIDREKRGSTRKRSR
jgi:metal-responsive CopG/Arc/MetJ family transcriptional regulator